MVDTLVEVGPKVSAWFQLVLQLGMMWLAWQLSRLYGRYAQWTAIWVAFGLGLVGMLASTIFVIGVASDPAPWVVAVHRYVSPLSVRIFFFLGFFLLYRGFSRTPRGRELPDPARIDTDEQSVVTAWDCHAETMFGWSASEAIGQTLMSLIIPERYHQGHRAGVARYLRERDHRSLSARYEVEAKHKDLSEFKVIVRISIVPQPDGRVQFAGMINRLDWDR